MIKLLLAAFLLAAMTFDIKHALHMFQQNRYEPFRYTSWLKEHRPDQQDIIFYLLWILICLVPLLFHSSWLRSSYIVLLAIAKFLFAYRAEQHHQYVKPLKWTGRVKRQLATLIVIECCILWLWFYLPAGLWGLAVVGGSLVSWFLIYPVYWLNEPVERAVRNHYLNQAKQILTEHKNLIKIGITGSYGKTSTKNILQAVLADGYYSLMTPASYNTPMGITITIREMLKPIHQVFICEMGADKVGEITYLMDFVQPRYGIVTSIGPQHLNTFQTMDNIIREKMQMIEQLPADGVGFINVDNEYIRNYQIKNSCQIVTFGLKSDNVDYRAVDIDYAMSGSTFRIIERGAASHDLTTRLLGEHNVMNVLTAVAVARVLGVDWDDIVTAVSRIDHIEHRLQPKTINGYHFIDNAFNSNPAGAAMSLEVLSRMPNRRIIVTPGMIDLGDRQDEENENFGRLMKGQVDLVILVGRRQTAAILRGLKAGGFPLADIITVDTVKEAFAKVYEIAAKEDTILLENDLPDAFNN